MARFACQCCCSLLYTVQYIMQKYSFTIPINWWVHSMFDSLLLLICINKPKRINKKINTHIWARHSNDELGPAVIGTVTTNYLFLTELYILSYKSIKQFYTHHQCGLQCNKENLPPNKYKKLSCWRVVITGSCCCNYI